MQLGIPGIIVSDITVLTLVHNVRESLPRCLESVSWADAIFCVVDPNTKDGSDSIAREYTQHIEVHEYVNAASQRNWALPQIETEWTLVLDADEWLSEELSAKIQAIISDPQSEDGYTIRRQSYFFGKLIRHCGWHRDYNLRLFRTEKGRYLEKSVHSKLVVEGGVGRITASMFHLTYRNLEEYFSTFQRFTTWGAQDAFDRGRRAGLTDLTLRPPLRFLKMYVLRHGFLDGFHGAVLCGLAACSVFVKYAKLWQLQRLQDEGESGDEYGEDG
jgi:glycosyltransferase involved in cell wall biosynthesis